MDNKTEPAAPTWSLTDLARLADVTPRTIRYYISQGLLAAPTGISQAARYGESHLARLRLIRRLQREHLPLAEIRARLGGLSDHEVDALLGEVATSSARTPPVDSATDYIQRVLAGAPRAPVAPAAPAMLLRASADVASETTPPLVAPAPPSRPPATDAEPDRSTWERVGLTPDVELHLRRPLDRQTNKRVDRLIRIARELLEED
jgi:DNA-binding transcriptional MerR regulator